MEICGKCSHHYCGECMKTNEEIDVLHIGCSTFSKYNP